MGVCSDGARSLSELPSKTPGNQAWFEMADTEFDWVTVVWEFSSYQRYISINFERAHNSSNASVASSDQFIPRFFGGERERHAPSVAIFVTVTHALSWKRA